MNSKNFSDAMNLLDNKYVDEAIGYQHKRKVTGWLKFGAAAACLCLVVGGALTITNLKKVPPYHQGTTEQVYTLPQAAKMSVELVEWGGDHFKAITADAGNNNVFPVNAELSVVFDYDTEILLNDGTLMVFDPDKPDTSAIGWEIGTIIDVEFVNYTEYLEGNHFYNQVYARRIAPTE